MENKGYEEFQENEYVDEDGNIYHNGVLQGTDSEFFEWLKSREKDSREEMPLDGIMMPLDGQVRLEDRIIVEDGESIVYFDNSKQGHDGFKILINGLKRDRLEEIDDRIKQWDFDPVILPVENSNLN